MIEEHYVGFRCASLKVYSLTFNMHQKQYAWITLNMNFSIIWYFDVTMVIFWGDFLMGKGTNIVMDDGWVHPLAKTLPSLVSNLWWNIVMNEKLLGKW